MVTALLYIEGGGDRKDSLENRFRRGWKKFFERADVGGKTRIVRGGGRQKTYNRLSTAVSNAIPGKVPFLLVDSEDAVTLGRSTWHHVLNRDGWDQPEGAGNDQAFLMVQVMETWFLADREALRKYFGAKLKERAFKTWPNLENVPKRQVFKALKTATASCHKRYSKGEISFELLAQVDPVRVEDACPHAKALPEKIRAV